VLTRRTFLCNCAASLIGARLGAQAGPNALSAALLRQIGSLAQAFMDKYDVPALSLAYGRGTRMLVSQAYGLANRESHQQATPQSLFRIASLSKPITSAAVFTLVQAGKLHTSDLVFGPKGILNNLDVHSPSLQQITIRHLLTHTAGGWGNAEDDPMFRLHDRDRTVFLQHALNRYPLYDSPGTAYAYSNLGYFILGRVIERVSGQPYMPFVQQHVLLPLGLADMQLAARHPAPREVRYYGQGGQNPYDVPIELHDANGGWLATATDLVRFALGVFSAQDHAGAPALFTPETLAQLTRPTAANPHYACGWALSPDGDDTHIGAFPGTASLLMHRHDGLAWALLTNTRRPHSPMDEDLRQLSWAIARSLPANA
jgi:CubicO group peptidase (beta-lactamase class C family)